MNDNIVNIGTRTNRFTMFSYILSCKSRPGAFIERNIFYASHDKSEIKSMYPTRQVCRYTELSLQDCAQHVCKGRSLSQVDCTRAIESSDREDSLTESIFV